MSIMAVTRAETLQSLVAHVVAVKDVRLIRDKFTGQPRGFGFMEFHSVQDAARALQLLQVFIFHNFQIANCPDACIQGGSSGLRCLNPGVSS